MDKQRPALDHNGRLTALLNALTFRTKPRAVPILDLVTLQSDISSEQLALKVSSRKAALPNAQEDKIRRTVLSGGFAGIGSLKILPYMVSDTSPDFVRDFGSDVLKVRWGN